MGRISKSDGSILSKDSFLEPARFGAWIFSLVFLGSLIACAYVLVVTRTAPINPFQAIYSQDSTLIEVEPLAFGILTALAMLLYVLVLIGSRTSSAE